MKKLALILGFLFLASASWAIRYDLRSDSTILDVSSPSFRGLIQLSTAPAPSTPAPGKGKFYLKDDGHPYFKDALGSEFAMTGSSTVYPSSLNLVSSSRDEGQMVLTSPSWNVNRAVLNEIKVSVPSGTSSNYTVKIYSRITFLEADRVYALYENSSVRAVDVLTNKNYEDLDANKSVYFEIVDNDGTGAPKFNIELIGWSLN